MQAILNWVNKILNYAFIGAKDPNADVIGVPGRKLTGVPIFGGEAGANGGGGLFGAFGTGATGLLKVIGQINFLALIIGAGLLFMSLFLCIFGLVQAALEGDPRGIAEARIGLITCFISLGLLNMVPVILGLIYRIAGVS